MPLVRTDVSEERAASIIRVIRFSELGTTLAVTSNRSMMRRVIAKAVPSSPNLNLKMKVILSSETLVLTRDI
jgi:hypothetical protein